MAERLLLPRPFLDGAAFREDSTAHILGRFQPSLPTLPPPQRREKDPAPYSLPNGGGALELRLDASFIHAPSYSSILNFKRRWAQIRTPNPNERRGTRTPPSTGAPVHSPRPGGPGRLTGHMSTSGNPAVPSRSLEVVLWASAS